MKLRIHIKNFRAIRNTQLDINSGVNILIGPNGSGKTTLFLALKFLRDVLLHGVGLAVAKEGGARRTFRRGKSKISFKVEYDLGQRVFRRRKVPFKFVWAIEIAQRGKEGLSTIIRERATTFALKDDDAVVVFNAEIRRNKKGAPRYTLRIAKPKEIGKDLFSYSLNTPSETKMQAFDLIKREFNEILKQAKKGADKSFFTRLAQFDTKLSHLYSSFQNLNEYNILPDVARQSTDQLPFVEMLPNGGNLSEVIHALENKNFHKITRSRAYLDDYFTPPLFRHYYYDHYEYPVTGYKSRIRKEITLKEALANINTEIASAVKPIEGVAAEIDLTNGKRFVVFKSGKETFYPEEVSDGTMKWLCILVSIYVPFSQLYLLEEPENFLHPWMQQRLNHLMREQAINNRTIFLLTSHSTTIINSAQPGEVVIVKSTAKGTIASAIQPDGNLTAMLKGTDFGLGDLWVSGALGAVPGDDA